MIILDKHMIGAITKDRLNEFPIVIGEKQGRAFKLKLNTNGRWTWENLLTSETIPGFYISRPEAIDGFPGDIEAFKCEESAYSYLRQRLLSA